MINTTFYPVVGSTYVVREWDDTVHKVLVVGTSGNDQVTFKYEDGLTHTTTADYFSSLIK